MDQLWWRMQAVRDARQRRLPDGALPALRAASAARHAEQGGDPDASAAACVLPWCCATTCATAAASRRHTARHRPARHEVIIANAYHGARRQAAPRAGDGCARACVRLLLQGGTNTSCRVPRSPPVVARCWRPGSRFHEYAPQLPARQGGCHRRGRPAPGHGGFCPTSTRSLLLAREANGGGRRRLAIDLRQRLVHRHAARAGRRMDPARYASTPWRQRVLDRVAFGLMRLALWVTGNRY